METLYAKLYDKYTKLKTKKFSELDNINKDQEVKFLKCVSVAEELIEHLKNENDKLRARVNELRNEVASFSSKKDEQSAEYQKLLLEETQKNRALSEALERLQNLQREGLCCSSKDDRNNSVQLNTPGGAQVESVDISNVSAKSTTRKRGRPQAKAKDLLTPSTTGQVHESTKELSKQTMSNGALVTIEQPECWRKTTDSSGGGGNENGPANCLYQSLFECLVGMKLSTVNQTEGIGYSFSLTWVNKADGKESELLYHVLSLGTFERIVPELLREDLMFSARMCPLFFERVSRLIKGHI